MRHEFDGGGGESNPASRWLLFAQCCRAEPIAPMFGLSERNRTADLMLPKHAFYLAELHSDNQAVRLNPFMTALFGTRRRNRTLIYWFEASSPIR